MGDTVGKKYESLFSAHDKLRMAYGQRNNLPKGPGILNRIYPLKVSRATNRMEDVKKFYSSDVGVDTLYNHKYQDGTEQLIIMYNKPQRGVQIHFWQGAKPGNTSRVGAED